MINKLQEKAISLLLKQGNFTVSQLSKALNIDKKLVSEFLKDKFPKIVTPKKIKVKTKNTADEKAQIVLDLYNQGKSMRAIQRESHISYDTISKVLKKNKIKVKINKILTEKDKEQISKMYNSGSLQPELAEQFNVSVSTIKQVVKKMGITRFNRINYPEKYSKKIQNEILRLYKNEEAGIQKISRELKVSQTAIRKLLAEKNIDINASQRYRENISENLEAQIIEMYQRGIACIPIKDKLNISREKVKNILKKHCLYKDWLLNKIENSENIIDLFNKGNSIKQIAKKTSEKEPTIEKFLKANDFIKEEKTYIPENLTDKQYQEVINLYLEGKNMMDISKKMMINYSYIATIIKKTKGLREKKEGLKKHLINGITPKTVKIKEKNLEQDIISFVSKEKNLTSVPEEITNLKSLKILDLANNALTEIPDFVYNLSKLEILNLSGNKIKKLAAGIKKLKNLKILDLKNNSITNLPKDITLLNNLESLDISHNPIKNLPAPESYFFKLPKFYIDVRFSSKKK